MGEGHEILKGKFLKKLMNSTSITETSGEKSKVVTFHCTATTLSHSIYSAPVKRQRK